MNSNQTSLKTGLSGFSFQRVVSLVTLFMIQTYLSAQKAVVDSLARIAAKDTAVQDSTHAALNKAAEKQEGDNLIMEVGISVAVIAVIVVVTWMMSSGGRKDKNAKPSSGPPPKPNVHSHAHHGHRR